MKTTRYGILFRILSFSTIGLFGLMAVAGVLAYTIHSSHGAGEGSSVDNIGNAGLGPNAATPGNVVRPPATPPVEILATPPRELLAASGSVNPPPAAAAPSSRPPMVQSAAPSSPTTTITRAPGSNERTVARPPQPVASAPSDISDISDNHGAGPDDRPSGPDRSVEVRRAIPVTHPADRNGPVEVRRAIPVSSPANANATRSSVAGAPSQWPPPPSVTERQIVETLPDGRTRITYIRTVRTPGAARATAVLSD